MRTCTLLVCEFSILRRAAEVDKNVGAVELATDTGDAGWTGINL